EKKKKKKKNRIGAVDVIVPLVEERHEMLMCICVSKQAAACEREELFRSLEGLEREAAGVRDELFRSLQGVDHLEALNDGDLITVVHFHEEGLQLLAVFDFSGGNVAEYRRFEPNGPDRPGLFWPISNSVLVLPVALGRGGGVGGKPRTPNPRHQMAPNNTSPNPPPSFLPPCAREAAADDDDDDDCSVGEEGFFLRQPLSTLGEEPGCDSR
ncbi:hypothetical protein BHE74_00053874, partial [Ensete ventricosum]